jgi:hypothetical protein
MIVQPPPHDWPRMTSAIFYYGVLDLEGQLWGIRPWLRDSVHRSDPWSCG